MLKVLEKFAMEIQSLKNETTERHSDCTNGTNFPLWASGLGSPARGFPSPGFFPAQGVSSPERPKHGESPAQGVFSTGVGGFPKQGGPQPGGVCPFFYPIHAHGLKSL